MGIGFGARGCLRVHHMCWARVWPHLQPSIMDWVDHETTFRVFDRVLGQNTWVRVLGWGL